MILLVKDAVMRYIETRDSYLEKKKKKNRLADSGNRDWNDGIIFLGCLWLVLDFFDSGNPNDFWEKKDPVIGLIRAHSFRHPSSLSLSLFFTVCEQTFGFSNSRLLSIVQTFHDTRIADRWFKVSFCRSIGWGSHGVRPAYVIFERSIQKVFGCYWFE